MRDRRFSQVWLVLLATTAAIAVPEVHRADASTESRLGTNGTQIRQSLLSPESELAKPVLSAPKPIIRVVDIPAAAPIKNEPLVTRSPAELAPIAAQSAIVTSPMVLAQSGQESPNRIQITPDGPAKPSIVEPIQAPTIAPGQVAPAPSRAPELPTITTPPGTPSPAPASEARVLVGEVLVTGAGKQELEDEVYRVIKTRPGQTATRTQLQEDINAIFAMMIKDHHKKRDQTDSCLPL